MKKLAHSNDIKSRVIICGGRHFDNYDCLEETMDGLLAEFDLDFDNIEIISGHCSGADQLGEKYAENNNILCSVFPAQWKKYGRAAGPIRNSEMISYASESDFPIIVAFVSPKTRGTNDTVKKAEKQKFTKILVNYENIESSVSIFGGIRVTDDNEYMFDFDNDESGDIVKLSKQHINKTRMYGNTRYFGYKVERDVEESIRRQFLSWIKTKDGYSTPGVEEMIDRCVEEFVENNQSNYDYIISVASSSALTSILANKLSEAFDAPVVSTYKLSVDDLKLDKDLATSELMRQGRSDNYISLLLDNIQRRYIDPQKKSGTFSMRRVASRFRKWIAPMFRFDDAKDVINSNSVLIVDENITTGSSVNQVISLLKSSKFSGTIDVFTLLSNR